MARYILLLGVFMFAGCIASPRTLQSENVIIETATIVANPDGVQYLLVASFEDSIPENTQAVVIYQDFSNPEQTRELALGSMSDARQLTFKSKPTKAVTKQPTYRIELLLFQDDSKGKLLARRQLTLPLAVSDRVATIFGITWL